MSDAKSKAESDRIFGEWWAKVEAFEKRESEDCPHCNQHVESLRQVGRCVYCDPCGCRLWQGTIPRSWKGKD